MELAQYVREPTVAESALERIYLHLALVNHCKGGGPIGVPLAYDLQSIGNVLGVLTRNDKHCRDLCHFAVVNDDDEIHREPILESFVSAVDAERPLAVPLEHTSLERSLIDEDEVIVVGGRGRYELAPITLMGESVFCQHSFRGSTVVLVVLQGLFFRVQHVC